MARFDVSTLAALVALAVAWIALNMIAVQIGPGHEAGLSFLALLAVLNSPMGVLSAFGAAPAGTGPYGVFATLALLAPLAPQFWQDGAPTLALCCR